MRFFHPLRPAVAGLAFLAFLLVAPVQLFGAAVATRIAVVSALAEAPEVASLAITPVGGSPDASTVRTEAVPLVEGRGEVVLELPSGTRWDVRATTPGDPGDPGAWSPPVEIVVGEEITWSLTLWPAVAVEAGFRFPEDLRPGEEPEVARLRLAPAETAMATGGDRQPPGTHEIACPVVERRLADCAIPAGRWNLRLAAGDLAPHFLWAVEARAPEALALGAVRLRRGGSVFGELATEDGPVDPERARVWLQPVSAAATDPSGVPGAPKGDGHRLRELAESTRVDRRGTFQLVGVPPGSYEIRATHPGYMTLHHGPVAVERGVWTELDAPLVLERPLWLSLAITPTAAPFRDPWSLRLYEGGATDRLRRVGTGTTDPAGLWTSPPLRAGTYTVQVLDREGSSVLWQEIVVEPGRESHALEIPLVYVEGRVLLDDEPLAATVWFGGASGTESVEVASDEAGELFAVLPREGSWTVDVRAESPPVASRGIEVEVEPIAGLDVAEVTIRVPDTSLVGEVVDEAGRPWETPAQIRLQPVDDARPGTSTLSGAAGRFAVRGVGPGTYLVEAETADARSEPVTVRLQEDQEPSVRLVLRSEREVAGRVLYDGAPVPGAQVVGYPVTGPGRAASMALESARTGADGRFRLAAPAAAGAVRLVVEAPGHPLLVARVQPGEEAELSLGTARGTLHFTHIADLTGRTGSGTVGLVLVDGEPLDLARLLSWASLQGRSPTDPGTLTVPAMPPGPYALCRLPLQEALLVVSGSARPRAAACTDGFLAPGGELVLDGS